MQAMQAMQKKVRKGNRVKAYSVVADHFRRGEISKPDACELCLSVKTLYGHHWNGYDNPLDLWWICGRCNRILSGESWHNGSATFEQAKAFVFADERRVENQLKTTDAAKYCGVTVNTVRNWCRDYGEFLSIGLRSPLGEREFTGRDLVVLKYISTLRASGMQKAAIMQRLSETSFGDTEEIEADQPLQPNAIEPQPVERNEGYNVPTVQSVEIVTRAELTVLQAQITDIDRRSRDYVSGLAQGFILALLFVLVLGVLALLYARF